MWAPIACKLNLKLIIATISILLWVERIVSNFSCLQTAKSEKREILQKVEFISRIFFNSKIIHQILIKIHHRKKLHHRTRITRILSQKLIIESLKITFKSYRKSAESSRWTILLIRARQKEVKSPNHPMKCSKCIIKLCERKHTMRFLCMGEREGLKCTCICTLSPREARIASATTMGVGIATTTGFYYKKS